MSDPSELHPTSFGKFTHRFLLCFGERFGNGDGDLDQQVPLLAVFLDALPADLEALTRRSAGGDTNRDLFFVERLHADARAERGLGDVEGAVQCGKALVDAYPAHPLAPVALYFNAVVLNEDGGVQEAAAFYLDRLCTEYPGDSLAKDAVLYRETLGMKQEDWNKRLRK